MALILDHLTNEDTVNWSNRLRETFGTEWRALSALDRLLIIKDCTVESGVQDLAKYRSDIGTGNLRAYVATQRVRFGYR